MNSYSGLTQSARRSKSFLPRAAAIGAIALVGGLLAGCGSSNNNTTSSSAASTGKPASGSTIVVGYEGTDTVPNAVSTSTSSIATTSSVSSTSTSSIGTPTSGPLSKEPTITAPNGAAPTSLVKKDLIVGTGPVAKAGETVTVNYVGVLYKGGTPFDASWNRKMTFSFALGAGAVIPGWDQGVAGMKVGGRRELIIPPALGYGAQGQPPTIPANATLIFDVDLLGVSGG
jgi:peptidylprolyl isomerase